MLGEHPLGSIPLGATETPAVLATALNASLIANTATLGALLNQRVQVTGVLNAGKAVMTASLSMTNRFNGVLSAAKAVMTASLRQSVFITVVLNATKAVMTANLRLTNRITVANLNAEKATISSLLNVSQPITINATLTPSSAQLVNVYLKHGAGGYNQIFMLGIGIGSPVRRKD